ncbi:MAG: hypothetical protein IH960_10800 [Chloroflexi bacterium]|nr:hypothetical protein [Chloroflexota bacterium]
METVLSNRAAHMAECASRNTLEEHSHIAIQENSLLKAHSPTGVAASGVGLVIVLLFALHPSVNAYHTGFAGLLVSAIFLIAVVAGASTKRIYVLAALLFLAFAEPGVRITNSLQFGIVSDGLLIGAGTTLLMRRQRIPVASFPILAILALIATMTIAAPLTIGAIGWIHVHDALIFVKYGLITVVAFTALETRAGWKIPIAAIAMGSAIAAIFSVVQAFHIPQVNRWIFETYFAASQFSSDDIVEITSHYFRSIGVAGPIGTATLLALSIGSWLILLATTISPVAIRIYAFGLLTVLLAIFLTGSRLGMLSATIVIVIGVTWWISTSPGRRILRPTLSVAAVFAVMFILIVATNQSFGRTVGVSTARVTLTLPNLIRGYPDPSFSARLFEYREIDQSHFGFGVERDTEMTNEYLILLRRFGPAGFLAAWLAWGLFIARTARPAFSGPHRGRILGAATLLSVTAAIVSAVGIHTILDPSRMTIILGLVGIAGAATVPEWLPRRVTVAGSIDSLQRTLAAQVPVPWRPPSA